MSELVTTAEHLPYFKGTEYEEHVNAWLEVDKDVQERYWMLGAIAASLKKKYGEDSFSKFGSDVGSSRRRVYEYAQTYEKWELCDRSHILSFKHHTIAGRSPEPQRAIEVAEDEQLSTRELDAFVKTGELPARKVKQMEEEVHVADMEIARIIRTATMEYVVEYGDGARHTVSKGALIEAGFKQCKHCSGRGVEERHH